MSAAFLIVLLTAASFVAGAIYGREAEAKLIARAMQLEASLKDDCTLKIAYFQRRIAQLKALL